jgi:hypothetical protein
MTHRPGRPPLVDNLYSKEAAAPILSLFFTTHPHYKDDFITHCIIST